MSIHRIYKGSGGGGDSTPTSAPDNLRSLDTIEAILGICEGPIGGLFDGPRSFFLGDTPLVNFSGTDNFSGFVLETFQGDETASNVVTFLGGTASNTAVNIVLAKDVPIIRLTTAGLRNQIDRLEIRINFTSLWKIDNGVQDESEANLKIQYRQVGSGTWLNFFSNEVIVLKGKTTSAYIKEFIRVVPRQPNDWEIRVTKLDDDDDPDFVAVYSWESFQEVNLDPQAFDGTAVTHIAGRASDQLSSVPELSGIYRGRLVKVPINYDPLTRFYDESPPWDGVTWKTVFTDNPAWCLLDLLTNTRFGLISYFPQIVVDQFDFYAAAKFCDEFVPRGDFGDFQPRYTYNDVIDKARSGLDQLRFISAIFGGVLYDDFSGVVRLIIDQNQTPVQIFGPESVGVGGFEYAMSDVSGRINDIQVSFTNPLLDWNEDRRNITDSPAITANGRIPLDFVALGCLDPHEATRRAQFRLLTAQTEVTTVSFQTARAALMARVFDQILIADQDMGWSQSARMRTQAGLLINTRDDMFLTVNTPFNIQVQTKSGLVQLTVENRTQAFITRQLTITVGTWPADAPAWTQFSIEGADANTGFAKPFKIIKVIKDSENSETFNIVAVEVNVNKQSDADAVASSPHVPYSFRQTDRPFPPMTFELESGTNQLIISADGSIRPRVFLRWEGDPRVFVEAFFIEFKKSTAGLWSGFRVEGRHAFIDQIVEGVSYDFRVRAINVIGNRSEPVEILNHVVLGKTQPPTDATSLVATQDGADAVLIWTGITDLDLKHYEIRAGASWALGTVLGTSPVAQFIHVGVASSPITYWVKAIDTTAHESVTAATTTLVISAPTAVATTRGFLGDQVFFDWTAATGDSPVVAYVIEYDNGAGRTEVFRGLVLNHSYKANWLGARTFFITSVNQAGISSADDTFVMTIAAPLVPVVSQALTATAVELSWTIPAGTLPVVAWDIVDITGGGSVSVFTQLGSNSVSMPITWVGSKDFKVVAHDSAGNVSPNGLFTTLIASGGVTNFVSTVVEGQLTLTWDAVEGSLPVKRYIVSRKAILTAQEIEDIQDDTIDLPFTSIVALLVAEIYVAQVDWSGEQNWFVRAEDIGGNIGPFATVKEILDPPPLPVVSRVFENENLMLSWTLGPSELPVLTFDVNYGSDPDLGTSIAQLDSDTLLIPVDWTGNRQFNVRAINSVGDVGAWGSVTALVNTPTQPSMVASIVDASIDLTWTSASSTLPIKEYILKRGAVEGSALEINRVLGLNYQTPITWSGTETFWIIAVDTQGNESSAGSASLTIVAPGASVISAEVVDNNVLLRWTSDPQTLPIARYEIRKGDIFDTADILPGVDATFTVLFESVGGTFKYWVTPIDTAGNFGISASKSVLVNQPPDFILNALTQIDFSLGTIINGVIASSGDLVFGVDTVETFDDHFVDNVWTTPDAQVQAGFPIYIQPSELTGSYQEEIDYGVVLGSSMISVTLTEAVISGAPDIQIDIAWKKLVGDSWTEVLDQSQAFATEFQFVRITVNYVGATNTDVTSFSSMTIRLDAKLRTDADVGTAVSTDSGGTTINFNLTFVDISSIVVTPLATGAIIAVYDFVDEPNPTSFKVLLFNTSGVRQNGDFSWTARGF